MSRTNNACVFFILSLLLSPLALAYDCTNLSEFSWGGGMEQGSVYRANDGAYECTTNWCAWAEPGGPNTWWDQAWDFLGECGTDDPANSAPEISVVEPWNMVVGESQVFQANATDADGDIVSWELVIYWNTIDGWQSPTVIDSGVGNMLATVNMQGTWAPQYNNEYVMVARVTDSAGETTTVSRSFAVAETPDAWISLSYPKVMLAGQYSSASVTVWHPTNVLPQGTLSISSDGPVFWEGTSSSSSGGSGMGYRGIRQYSFQPSTDADITITGTAPDYDLQETGFIEVLPADGLPEIASNAPAQLDAGDVVTVTVSAKDTSGIEDFQVTLGGSDMLAAATTAYIGGDNAAQAYGIEATFTWTAQAGTQALQVIASDAENNVVEKVFEIEVAGDGGDEEPDPTGSCQAAGVDPATVNAYPNWPQLDWKGDPNNANTGDLMSYDGSVYYANWWTTTVPGSDNSWTWICDL